jgi:hypothetical protein
MRKIALCVAGVLLATGASVAVAPVAHADGPSTSWGCGRPC